MLTTSVIREGRYQTVRIPQEIETKCEEFVIKKIGDGYLLIPTDDPWFPLRLSIGQMPDDFLEERAEPTWDDMPEREEF